MGWFGFLTLGNKAIVARYKEGQKNHQHWTSIKKSLLNLIEKNRLHFIKKTMLFPTPKNTKKRKENTVAKATDYGTKRDKKERKRLSFQIDRLDKLGYHPLPPPSFSTNHSLPFPPFSPFFADKGIRVCECVDRRHSSFILFFYCVSWGGGRNGGSCAFPSLLSSNTFENIFRFFNGKEVWGKAAEFQSRRQEWHFVFPPQKPQLNRGGNYTTF